MSKLTNLVKKLEEKEYRNENGELLVNDVDYHELVELVSTSYMSGLINGAKRFSYMRAGVKVVGIMERPLSEFIKQTEKLFGMKYRGKA